MTWQEKFLELENSLNSLRESNIERLETHWKRMEELEAFSRESRTKIAKLENKTVPINKKTSPEYQEVIVHFLNFDHVEI